MGRKRQGFIEILAEWVENDKDFQFVSAWQPRQQSRAIDPWTPRRCVVATHMAPHLRVPLLRR